MKNSFYLMFFGFLVFCCDSSNSSTDDLPTLMVPSLLTTEATSVTYNSANSGGNQLEDNGSPITQKGVCWSIQPITPTIEDSHTSDGSGSAPYTSTLLDLEPNTDYFIRSYAINEAGVGYGAKLSLTTLYAPGTAPCNPVMNTCIFNSSTENLTVMADDINLQYGFYGVFGTNADTSLHVEFKEAPTTGVYETVEVGSTIFNSNCVIFGTFGNSGGEDYVSAAEDLVYVVKNGEGLYSITFCNVTLYSTSSGQSFTTDANLTTQ